MKPQTKILKFIEKKLVYLSNDTFFTEGERQRRRKDLIQIADKINEVFE